MKITFRLAASVGVEVRRLCGNRTDAEIAPSVSQRVCVQATAADCIAEVAHYARLRRADVALLEGRRVTSAVDELLVFIPEVENQVGVPRADDRMESVDAFHLALAA